MRTCAYLFPIRSTRTTSAHKHIVVSSSTIWSVCVSHTQHHAHIVRARINKTTGARAHAILRRYTHKTAAAEVCKARAITCVSLVKCGRLYTSTLLVDDDDDDLHRLAGPQLRPVCSLLQFVCAYSTHWHTYVRLDAYVYILCSFLM